ncbi:hypothetical protein [Amycolatopsis mediterranei]|uniref:hypothetical protein n=1 Tax=Amycolatopsis mediterranei TaxID=33910 RepID=UPI0002F221CA|nr:hypothetical protein [Amycolatopsis mediterranei]UZF67647.1 hypothetical protein ISP_000674 [Amycolatopsis mediterranei]
MNISRSARALARGFAALTAAAVLTSVFAGPAAADEPTPTTTAPATSEAPSTSEAPTTAPSSTEPENKPAAAQPQAAADERPQVKASVVLGKEVYQSDEDVHFTFTLTNTGTVPAKGLQIAQSLSKPTDLVVLFDDGGWGPLVRKPGVDLDPGKSFELQITGKIRDITQPETVVEGQAFDSDGRYVTDFGGRAKVEQKILPARGTVYGDRNGNGVFDDGEQLAGIPLALQYLNGSNRYPATSGPDGKVDFGKVPSAVYYLGGVPVGDWLIPLQHIHIGANSTDLLIRAVPPLHGALKASMAFTQDSYQAGDLAHLTVTLSNSGPIPLTGIVAACDRFGSDFALKGGPGWGDLDTFADGVAIAPGQTRTFDVTERVPEAARTSGIVTADCDFGYREVGTDEHPNVGAQAAVPGAKATLVGDVAVYDDRGQVKQGIAGTKVVLVSDRHCPVVAEQTTDEKGHFEFHDVVPGPEYRVFFLPPAGWKIKDGNPWEIFVRGPADRPVTLRVGAEQGDAPLPEVPGNPADCTAGAPATPSTGAAGANGGTGGGQSGGSGLASTGVDAIGLGALALLALALGGGLVFGARRRRRTI